VVTRGCLRTGIIHLLCWSSFLVQLLSVVAWMLRLTVATSRHAGTVVPLGAFSVMMITLISETSSGLLSMNSDVAEHMVVTAMHWDDLDLCNYITEASKCENLV